MQYLVFLSEQDSYSPRTQCVTLNGEGAHFRSLRGARGGGGV
ncbi:MAG: hypothetical protein ACLRVT_05065 [Oscillospiraceae bacterium]